MQTFLQSTANKALTINKLIELKPKSFLGKCIQSIPLNQTLIVL